MAVAALVYYYDVEVYENLFMVTVKSKMTGNIKTWMIYYDPASGNTINDFDIICKFFLDRDKWMVGYNSYLYDNQVMNYIIKNRMTLRRKSALEITHEIAGKSVDFINGDHTYKYEYFFNSIDLMRVGLPSHVRKSLKMIAINLKWYKIQDLPFVAGKMILPNEIEEMRLYNINDVLITERLYKELNTEINMRSSISVKYGVNVMEETDSGIANKLLERMYANATSQHPKQFKEKRSKRGWIKLSDCISDKVKFQTSPMKRLLRKLKRGKVSI